MIPSVMINLSTRVAPQRASSRPWLHISEQEKKKKLTSPCTRFRGGKEVCAGG